MESGIGAQPCAYLATDGCVADQPARAQAGAAVGACGQAHHRGRNAIGRHAGQRVIAGRQPGAGVQPGLRIRMRRGRARGRLRQHALGDGLLQRQQLRIDMHQRVGRQSPGGQARADMRVGVRRLYFEDVAGLPLRTGRWQQIDLPDRCSSLPGLRCVRADNVQCSSVGRASGTAATGAPAIWANCACHCARACGSVLSISTAGNNGCAPCACSHCSMRRETRRTARTGGRPGPARHRSAVAESCADATVRARSCVRYRAARHRQRC